MATQARKGWTEPRLQADSLSQADPPAEAHSSSAATHCRGSAEHCHAAVNFDPLAEVLGSGHLLLGKGRQVSQCVPVDTELT